MTTLCFYQGLKTIGGTVLEIATGQARCLFDFGLVYSPQADARVLPRPGSVVADSLKLGVLPMIEGLYARADLRDVRLSAYGETGPLPFVLISHMHIDHMGGLGMLAPDAEVIVSEESLLLYQGLVKAGDVFFRPHKTIRAVPLMEWQTRGDLSFRLIPVDHDVPGACGFEIVTPDGRICYTGDLRLHGFTDENTLRFAQTVQGADLCITEGVTASFIDDFDAVAPSADLENSVTEEQLLALLAAAAQDTKGLVYLNMYNRNIRRLHALHTQLKAAGRKLVLEPETALYYRQFYPAEYVRVYAPLAGEHTLLNAGFISRRELLEHTERYVLQLSYTRLLEILEYPAEGSLYLHADGAPLGAYDPGFQKLRDFLATRGIDYRHISSGGHATPAHLKYLLTQIAPKTLIPLHSLTPEKVRIDGSAQFLPEAGKVYRLEGGELR